MAKAAIVIGVDKTGNLPVLQSAAMGAKEVAKWLKGEGFKVIEHTDSGGKAVEIQPIKKSVEKLLADGNLQELVVYFSGHGFLKDGTEQWMLSGAPLDNNAAINLQGCELLARDSGVPHITFISDACRSTPDSLQASRVQGGEIFPNKAPRRRRVEIDRFYAAAPGDPAYEIQVKKSVKQYKSIFTDCFLRAFLEPYDDMVRKITQAGKSFEVVPSRSLRDYLEEEVDLAAQKKSVKLTQQPQSIVESDSEYYLSRLLKAAVGPRAPAKKAAKKGGSGRRPTSSRPSSFAPSSGVRIPLESRKRTGTRTRSFNLQRAAENAIAEILAPRKPVARPRRTTVEDSLLPEGTPTSSTHPSVRSPATSAKLPQPLAASVKATLTRLDVPKIFESRTGITLSGIRLKDALCVGMRTEILERNNPALIRLWPDGMQGSASILVRFSDGGGTVVAAMSGYFAHVIVEKGKVMAVNYVPSEHTYRYNYYDTHRSEIEKLRGLVAASVQHGALVVSPSNASKLAARIRIEKASDPSLGLYAAYAYANAGNFDAVKDILDYMRNDIHTQLFDVAMLARTSFNQPSTYPFCPMLSQGWSSLAAMKTKIHPIVLDAGRHRRQALWTTFDREGMDILEAAMQKGIIS